MRVIVCGGRQYADYAMLCAILDAFRAEHPDMELVEGGHRVKKPNGQIDWTVSADALARRWADSRAVRAYTEAVSREEWDQYKKSAGPRRNQRMLDKYAPELVIAFPSTGPGTASMKRLAKAAGVRVIEVGP